MVLPWTIGGESPEKILASVPNRLQKSLGQKLESLIVWGAYADPDADSSEISQPLKLLLVLSDFDLALFDSLSNVFESFNTKHPVSLLIQSRDELDRTTDVFPVRFLEMKKNYRVLIGNDVLRDLDIQLVHLRLRCEQEFKNLKMRLVNRLVMDRKRRHLLRASLERCAAALESTLLAAAMLVDAESESVNSIGACQAACEKLGLSGASFRMIMDQVKRISPASAEDLLVSLALEMIGFVDSAARVVDAIPDSVEVIEVSNDSSEGGGSRWS